MKHVFRLILIAFLFFAANMVEVKAAVQNFVPLGSVSSITSIRTPEGSLRITTRQKTDIQTNKDNGSIYNFKNDDNSSSSSNNPFVVSKRINDNIISHLYSARYLSGNAQVSNSHLLFQIQPNAP